MAADIEHVLRNFRANTLKSIVKWIHNPNDPASIRNLEKYIPLDLKRNLNGKKVTAAVEKQLMLIRTWSLPKKQFVQSILNDPSLLKNNQFVNNVLDTTRPNRHQLLHNNYHPQSLLPSQQPQQIIHHQQSKPQQPSFINNRNNNKNNAAITPFQYQAANPLITCYQTNEQKLNQLSVQIDAQNQKLCVLRQFESDPTMNVNVEPVTKALNQCTSEKQAFEFRQNILIEIIQKIRKKENELLRSKKATSLQKLLEKIVLSKTNSKMKLELKLNGITQQQSQINQTLLNIASNPNSDNSQLMTLLPQKKKYEEQHSSMQNAINDTEIFIHGIQLILNEVIYSQPVIAMSWYELSTKSTKTIKKSVPNLSNRPKTSNMAKHSNFMHNTVNNSSASSTNSVRSMASSSLPMLMGSNNRSQSQLASLPRSAAPSITESISCFDDHKNTNLSPKMIAFPGSLTPKRRKPAIPTNTATLKTLKTLNTQTTPKKKQKFKRPTRTKKAKAKKIGICDILPKQIFMLRLTNDFESNGCIRDESKSMIEAKPSKQRSEWIDYYNNKHIPNITKNWKLSYGNDIKLPSFPQPLIQSNLSTLHSIQSQPVSATNVAFQSPSSPSNKNKRSFTEMNQDYNHNNIIQNEIYPNKKMKVKDNNVNSNDTAECINDSSDSSDDNILTANHHIHGLQHQAIHNSKNDNNSNKNIDENHDERIFEDGNCLHFCAQGFCKWANNGRCKLKHPQEYNAKNFYCPHLLQSKDCSFGERCVYSHNLKDIPCSKYYSHQCDNAQCLNSHDFKNGKQGFVKWIITEKKRKKACKVWNRRKEKNNQQQKNLINANINDTPQISEEHEQLDSTSTPTNVPASFLME